MVRRLNFYRFCLSGIAYLLPLLAFALAFAVLAVAGPARASIMAELHTYGELLLAAMIVWLVAAERFGVTSIDELFYEHTGIRAAFAAAGTTYAVLLGVLVFSKNSSVSRLFLLISAFLLLAMTLAVRAMFRNIVRRHSEHRKQNRMLIVGADAFARLAAYKIAKGPLSFCCVVGYVRLDRQEAGRLPAPVYCLAELPLVCQREKIDELVIAIPPARFEEIPKIMNAVEKLCLPVRAVVDVGGRVIVRDRLFQCGGLQIFDLTATPAECVKYSLLKRAFDVAFSLIVLIAAAPLMALIAIAIRLSSPGPILFVHERVGLNGKIFRMYKFRSMRIAPKEESDSRWTTASDPRRTAVGALLRRTNLDELPQFFNVLKGDMSVVGPRPERPHFVQKFLNEVARYNNRHRLKVGITGWAQINGLRGDTSIRKRVMYDLYYLQNWSLGFDIRIIFLTCLSIFNSKNAY